MLLLLYAGLWWSLTLTPPYSQSSLNDISANYCERCDTEQKTQESLYKILLGACRLKQKFVLKDKRFDLSDYLHHWLYILRWSNYAKILNDF